MPYPDFLHLSNLQIQQLDHFLDLLRAENNRINLVSRTSIDEAEERHINHCLALGLRSVPAGAVVVDWGTGGGLPAIPLAVLWPHARIIAVDSILKKTRAVESFILDMELSNCTVWRGRAEHWEGRLDYSVSRATAPIDMLWEWHLRSARTGKGNDRKSSEKDFGLNPDIWEAGLLCFKGGDMTKETNSFRAKKPGVQVDRIPLESILGSPYFRDKFLLHAVQQ